MVTAARVPSGETETDSNSLLQFSSTGVAPPSRSTQTNSLDEATLSADVQYARSPDSERVNSANGGEVRTPTPSARRTGVSVSSMDPASRGAAKRPPPTRANTRCPSPVT
jgi:hypothetical protein